MVKFMRARWLMLFWFGSVASSSLVMADEQGKLLATPGVSQIEGSGGGGLVPWAQLAGYASDQQWAFSGFCSRASVDDFRLDSCGVQLNAFDRVELSVASQKLSVLPLATDIQQTIIGAKVRVYGDIVYSRWPQLSVGVQHKQLKDSAIAFALGADSDQGTDFYLAASKLHLAGVAGYNSFWNITARYSGANQLGLLGFSDQKHWQLEAAAALFLSPQWALGAEYRQKPDNLGLGEQAWRDLFVAWFPNKRVSVTAAYLYLGQVAGIANQSGWYLSVAGSW